MLLAVDLYEDFVDKERVSITLALSFQASGVNGTERVTPKADRFGANSDAAFSE
ncbi:MAG: hypothetical protein AB8B81_11260 [Halioglobus sp.]